jgi:hypothetical protein
MMCLKERQLHWFGILGPYVPELFFGPNTTYLCKPKSVRPIFKLAFNFFIIKLFFNKFVKMILK